MSYASGAGISRRQALRAGALLGAGAALVSCSSGSGAAQPTASAQPTAAPASAAAAPGPDSIVVTLLGTGSPVPRVDRFGPSTLVQAGGLNLLIDTGRACPVRLNQINVPLGKIDGVFLTHYHSDHVNGLPDLWMVGYLNNAFAARKQPLQLWGPIGIKDMAARLMDAFSEDARVRQADEHIDPVAMELNPNEFAADIGTGADAASVVFDRNGVRVTAFTVNHGPLIKPSVGYRVDYAGRSVLLSGDTKYNENLIHNGQGVDLLVHEVAVAPQAIANVDYIRTILDHHTTPEDCGRVFSQTRPRMAAFTHIVQLSDPNNPPPDDAEIERRTRTTWGGPLTIGTDLTRFIVAPSGVTVEHGDPNK